MCLLVLCLRPRDNQEQWRINLDGEDLWLLPAGRRHQHKQPRRDLLSHCFLLEWLKAWLEAHLESSDTRCLSISTSDCPIVCALAFKVSHFIQKLFLVVAC